MKLKKEDNRWYLYITKNLFVHTINEWEQIFGKYNWYTFTPVATTFEKDCYMGGYEAEVFLLGFGLRVRYNDKRARDFLKEIMVDGKKWDKKHAKKKNEKNKTKKKKQKPARKAKG